jgi:hypothetical protein
MDARANKPDAREVIGPASGCSIVVRQSVIAILAFLVAFGAAFSHFIERGGIGRSWQVSYAPAVFMACTGVFGQPLPPQPNVAEPPWSVALGDFLSQRTDTFNCSAIPRNLDIGWFATYAGGDGQISIGMQYSQLGHLILTGLLWKIFGVSWWGVSYLAALYCGLAFAFLALLFHRFVAAPIALVLALLPLLDLQTFHLAERIRDFAKIAPLFAAMFMLVSVSQAASSYRAFRWLAGLGVTLGIGITMRPEMTLYCIGMLAIAGLVLWTRRRVTTIAVSVGGFAVCLGLILLFYVPANVAYRDRPSYMTHALILGMQDQRLKETHLDVRSFSVMPIFSDQSVYRDASLLQQSVNDEPLSYQTDAYGVRTDTVFLQMAKDAPYYAAVRIAGAAYDFSSGSFGLAPNTTITQLARIGMCLSALVTLTALWQRNATVGFTVAGLIAVGAAISSLDYEWRHIVHMRWLGFPLALAGPAILLQRLLRRLDERRLGGLLAKANMVSAGPANSFLVVLTFAGLLVYAVVVAGAALAQERSVSAIKQRLTELDGTPVDIDRRAKGPMELISFPQEKAPFLVRLDFDLAACRKHYVRFRYRYRGQIDRSFDKSMAVSVYRGGKDGEHYFFSVHDDFFTRFDGIVLDAADAECLRAAYRLASPNAPFYYHVLIDGRWQPLGNPRF